jgi:hypothetical protein
MNKLLLFLTMLNLLDLHLAWISSFPSQRLLQHNSAHRIRQSQLHMAWHSPFQKLFGFQISNPSSSSSSRSTKSSRAKRYKSIALYCSTGPIISDATYEEWVEDIIYSGDIEGYIRRRSADLLNDDFLGYLEERIEACLDNDEKNVLVDILQVSERMFQESDGLVDSGVQFEKRLDRILFVAPQRRREAIEQSIDEMTPGFINYIQSEIKSATDSDIKVVLASILQLIGQVRNEDYLSATGIGKEIDKASLRQLNLLSDPAAAAEAEAQADLPSQLQGDKYYEQILAGLVFSKNDVLEDILNNLHYIDDGFIKFLEQKIESSTDIEERVGLSSLLTSINTVLTRVKDVQGDTVIDANDQELSIDQVKQRLKDIQSGQNVEVKKNQYATLWDYELKNNQRETFLGILQRFQNLPDNVPLAAVVEANYELCDLQFMESLKQEIASCYAEGADLEGQQYQLLQDAINQEMVKRMSTAQDRLAKILSKQSPKAMEAEIVAMVRRGEVDEALVLLIEGNIQQAEAANAVDAVKLLRMLNKRIAEEKEKKLPDEQRLLRALLREANSEKRKSLLYEAFRPSKSLNDDGEVLQGAPLISPPSFINLVRRVIKESGNIEGYKIMDRMLVIVDEAQVVATELYGEGMSPRDQQKYMFEKNSLSVWDLARYEEDALMQGEEVPWQNNAYDGKMPEDVMQERKVKQIGGLDADMPGM